MDSSEQRKLQFPGREFFIADESLTEAQEALVRRMEDGPRKAVPINQRIWMHNMAFAQVAESFGSYVSAEAPMSARIKEICILSIASFWQSDFEWHWHEKAARAKLITPEQIEAIRTRQDPDFIDPKEQAAYRLVQALVVEKEISDALYRETMDVLGLSETLDLIGLMSLYSMIAHTIMLFKLQIPQ